MASYYCPSCDEDYPKAKMFDDCPVCNTNTLFRAQHEPSVTLQEGERRVRSKISHAAFQEWCAQNGRGDGDPPRGLTVYMPSNPTFADQRMALAVSDMLERLFPTMTHLHVLTRGL